MVNQSNTYTKIAKVAKPADEAPTFLRARISFTEKLHTTDIVHGLDRQVQLKHQDVKFFIVASEDRQTKFQDLVTNRFPYRSMRDRFKFISYDGLAQLYEAALPFSELKKRLLGD